MPFVDHPGFLVHKYSFFPVPSTRNRSAMKIRCQGVKREYPGTGNDGNGLFMLLTFRRNEPDTEFFS
jgi:hypothetical protein